jgi:hypothetical protein
MGRIRFDGFSGGLFRFLRNLAENNSKEWFDEHRREYEASLLVPAKAFVAEMGPTLQMLNRELETEPRVGRTLSRINNDVRFNRNRLPYRPFFYISFPRRGQKWSSEALYVGIYQHGVSVGFYPGHRALRPGPVQDAIRDNLPLFQRYLSERHISRSYWELVGGEEGDITKWPLPKTARRWINLDGFTVGEYFPRSEPALATREFLDRTQRILLDLYPLWLFATSDTLKEDLELYLENAKQLRSRQ